MASGALDWGRWFIEVGWGFYGVLLSSRTLRWMVAKTRGWYGWTSLPPASSYDLRLTNEGTNFLSSAALSHHAVVGGGIFPEGAKPLGLDIWCGVDRPGTCAIESYMEKLTFIRDGYPTSELSCRLCVYPWSSGYVRQRWDGFQHLSTCCQTCVSSYGHIMSRQLINITAFRDPGAGRAYPVLKAPGHID
jgi:hypothetical protein